MGKFVALVALALSVVVGLALVVAVAAGSGGDQPGPAIPATWLPLYRQAAAGCPGMSWSILAAVGTVETGSGRSTAPGVWSGANSAGAEGPMQFEPETFAVLVDELDALHCDLLAPKILFEDRIHIWSAGGTFEALKGYHGSHVGEGELDSGQYDTAKRINNAPGCCILVRREVFDRIGMMDAKYFVYHDDADFLFRAWRAGLKMFYTPRARIFHKVSSLTGGSQSAFTIRYNARGHVYFMLKNLGVTRCFFYLPALQVRMFFKLLFRTISWKEFVIRQRAFFEGISVWLSR